MLKLIIKDIQTEIQSEINISENMRRQIFPQARNFIQNLNLKSHHLGAAHLPPTSSTSVCNPIFSSTHFNFFSQEHFTKKHFTTRCFSKIRFAQAPTEPPPPPDPNVFNATSPLEKLEKRGRRKVKKKGSASATANATKTLKNKKVSGVDKKTENLQNGDGNSKADNINIGRKSKRRITIKKKPKNGSKNENENKNDNNNNNNQNSSDRPNKPIVPFYKRLWNYISYKAKQHPRVVTMCSSALLIGGGDVVSQIMLEDGRIDWKRVGARATGSALSINEFIIQNDSKHF